MWSFGDGKPQPSANQQERGASAIGTRPIQPSLFPGKGGSGNAADSLVHPTLLACDEVLPETDQPLRPMPRINVARDMGLMQPPPLVMTAPSVAQKFQERLTAAMSDPGRHSVAGASFPLGTAGGSAFAGARPEPHIGESSLIPKPRRRKARAAAPVGFFEEPDFTSGGETEPEVSEPPQPPRRAAKARHASRASAAPAQPSLPRKTVKKQQSGMVIIGRRSLNAYAAVIAAKKKMGRFLIRRSDISGLGVFTMEFCEAGELLMECVGEVVRRPVASMREAAAAARGVNDVACYVFALDADHVVDTTKSGNPARFVNHSCSPNCVASAMDVKGARHIFLIAATQLAPGEELTYDYSLSASETGSSAAAQSLIPCNCQSPNCYGYI
ncbi:hypothetical protein WJX75_003737 [Coccomyxa subellipsoidea]|uniref:[histone H3]-lysine(4) N-trimethyltransferase n=1 Tax=Coccomyxa subellipsoidea TaxID=248742 RepID=A0ABR2YXX3_9CHLO